ARGFAELRKWGGEPRQLDVLRIEADALRDPCGEIADTLRVAAGVRVACVDGLRQGRRGAVARGLVGAGGKPLQLRELDDVWPVDPYAVLPVLLRPVERAVRETDELVTAVPLQRERREPGAHGDVAAVVEV